MTKHINNIIQILEKMPEPENGLKDIMGKEELLERAEKFASRISMRRYVNVFDLDDFLEDTTFDGNPIAWTELDLEDYAQVCGEAVKHVKQQYGVELDEADDMKAGLILNAIYCMPEGLYTEEMSTAFVVRPAEGCEIGDMLPLMNALPLVNSMIVRDLLLADREDLVKKLLSLSNF